MRVAILFCTEGINRTGLNGGMPPIVNSALAEKKDAFY